MISLQILLVCTYLGIGGVFDNFLSVSLLKFAHSALLTVGAHSTPHLSVFVRGAGILQLQIESYRLNLLHADGGPRRGAFVIRWKLQKVLLRARFVY